MRKTKSIKYNVTVKIVPHPNPQKAIDVIANLVLKKLMEIESKPQ